MADANIRIEAVDDAGNIIESVSNELKGLGETGAQAGERAGEGFQSFANSMAEAGSQVERGMSLMTRLDLVQLTVQMSTDRVAQEQDKYNAALAKYGASSTEAVNAAENLKRAHESLDKAQLRAELSLGLVIASSVQMAATAIPTAITALEGLATAETAAAFAGGVLQVTLGGAAAAIGIVAGITAVTTAMHGISAETTSSTANLEKWKTDGSRSMESLQAQAVALTQRLQELQAVPARKLTSGEQGERDRAIASTKEELRAVGDLEQGYTDAAIAAGNYAKSELEKATLESTNIVAIAAMRDKATQDEIAQDALLRTMLGGTQREIAQAAKDADDKMVADSQAALDRIAADHKAAADKVKAAWQASLSAAGINFHSFSDGMLADLAAVGDQATAAAALAEVGQRTKDLARWEELLKGTSGATRDAILKQMAAVKDKTGATYLLNDAVADTTITEEEHRRALLTTTAAVGASTGAAGGYTGSSPTVATLDNGSRVTRTTLGHMSAVDMWRELAKAEKAHPEMKGLSNVHAYESSLRRAMIGGKQAGSNVSLDDSLWWMRQSLLPYFEAAQGFDGTVKGPTMFLAGEAGAEHVKITPKGGGASMGPIIVNVYLQKGEGTEDGVKRGVISAIGQARRMAARRTF